jgi:hypothetical protein
MWTLIIITLVASGAGSRTRRERWPSGRALGPVVQLFIDSARDVAKRLKG